MQAKAHWESIYTTKAAEDVSWYRSHLDTSLALIERVVPSRSSSIIDVGAGESTLVDDLVLRGYSNLSVLDVSETALRATKERLGSAAARIRWWTSDVCEADLPLDHYDVWHDRAVFHFLTLPDQRASYVARASKSLRADGQVVIGTFGPDGPTCCSGLQTVRYDASLLREEFGSHFKLVESVTEAHSTPSGIVQQFLYCVLQKI